MARTRRWAEANAGIGRWFLRTVDDLGNVANINRPAIENADHQPLQFMRRLDEWPTLNLEVPVAGLKTAGMQIDVGPAQDFLNLHRRHLPGGQLFGIQKDADLPPPPADHFGPGRILDGLQRHLDLFGHAPERVVVRFLAPQRDIQHRHVIDLDRFDDPAGHSRRDQIDIHRDFVVELDEALLPVLADVEANRHDGLSGPRQRVNVLDTVDLIEQPFEPVGDLLFDDLGDGAGHLDVDVGERHDDLWFFLARREIKGCDPGNQHDQNEQDRQVSA